ncbi:peptide chain release factor 2 [Candidatus Nomurabacteria bacterium CG22_combo_CG10-13_8_21_14_all_32_8]|uniref:Peptide chain release factor 2 n=2 Tax=Candidatus Nomuraibacteriota TaxID=1752729 RepID=A0A2H0CGU5_9BACT|nr:MAG: peptide chain release factor 2 [Candidatus Nomurabacteria bacterium CG22_combo_CG10-13_8_21_14_all_32_8]PIZ85715.1 MAG: peptide chain release factor 2 [Candidatus Nomurabacteria bacterium CG_4_10_14_0_2_um_filter_33_9]
MCKSSQRLMNKEKKDVEKPARNVSPTRNDSRSDSGRQSDVGGEIEKLEAETQQVDFWNDKNKAQAILKKIAELKDNLAGAQKYDKGNAIVTIISGAGGDDAEDFSRILLDMYMKYAIRKNWEIFFIHEHKNDHGGYRNVSFEIKGHPSTHYGGNASVGASVEGPYGVLKNESGVHRLVRISPFNAKKLRHTSFSLVEVLPKFSKLEEKDFIIPENDLKIEYSRSSGPGGQNVNKRETAVRLVHIPTNISVHASGERSQEQNRERAMSILLAKIFKKAEEEKKTVEESMKISKGTEIEWGSQIRSYVLHPYKMVKDHRTSVETSNIDAVLDGDIDLFIDPIVHEQQDEEKKL